VSWQSLKRPSPSTTDTVTDLSGYLPTQGHLLEFFEKKSCRFARLRLSAAFLFEAEAFSSITKQDILAWFRHCGYQGVPT